jgi:hypothetical protein
MVKLPRKSIVLMRLPLKYANLLGSTPSPGIAFNREVIIKSK